MTSRAASPAGLVTLLTDFGQSDPFVGVMKGVMLDRAPALRLVDLTHQIAQGDVHAAGFWLERSYAWFPAGSVHLVVVDPGVGTSRRALALSVAEHRFVGPDNGLFARVVEASLRHGSEARAHEIDVARLRQRLGLTSAPSRTFHGRDVFAPAAALLASGTPVDALGPAVELDGLARTTPRTEPCVAVVDHFGNLITSAEAEPLSLPAFVEIAGQRLRLVGTYGEARPGECVALIGSFGTFEVAVRDGSAAALLGVGAGDPVRLISA